MADFATLADAEARAVAKVKDGTWIEAHACRQTRGGKFAVRVIRPMSPSSPGEGAWVELTDDAAV